VDVDVDQQLLIESAGGDSLPDVPLPDVFNCAIECTRELLEFYMYARYKYQDDAALSYMEDALHRYHTFKDVFLLGRAGKR